ncbi:hypothetical protein GOODEAATRI_026581 [Goodea atripinnis]|uniref:Uncharacterized protein n=1 Tax=Goodea atripinnis TaxID=208336 RepID=A0ABV0PS76_9TELE
MLKCATKSSSELPQIKDPQRVFVEFKDITQMEAIKLHRVKMKPFNVEVDKSKESRTKFAGKQGKVGKLLRAKLRACRCLIKCCDVIGNLPESCSKVTKTQSINKTLKGHMPRSCPNCESFVQ